MKPKQDSTPVLAKVSDKILASIISAFIVALVGGVLILFQKVAILETEFANFRIQGKTDSQITLPTSTEILSSRFIQFIKAKQGQYIKKCTGTDANSCFTDLQLKDLQAILNGDIFNEELKQDPSFIELLTQINQISATEWLKMRDKAKTTFSSILTDPADIKPNEQTKAGQQGEILIVNTIIESIEKSRANHRKTL